MMSLSDDTQADIIEAFNSIFKYLEDLLNIDNFTLKCLCGDSRYQNIFIIVLVVVILS